MGLHLTVEQRRRVRQLRVGGMAVAEVARGIGCSLRTVKRVVASRGKREERQLVAECPAAVVAGA